VVFIDLLKTLFEERKPAIEVIEMSDILKEEEEFFEEFAEEFNDEMEVRYMEQDPEIFMETKKVREAQVGDVDLYYERQKGWKRKCLYDSTLHDPVRSPDDVDRRVDNPIVNNQYRNDELNPYTVKGLYSSSERGNTYTIAQKVAAVQGWLISGGFPEAARLSNVPVKNIRMWKYRSEWWPEVARRLKLNQQDSVEAMLNAVVQKSLGQIMDRLETGDEVLTKDGDRDYVKIKAKDLASIVARMQIAKKNMSENQEDHTKEVNTLGMLEEKLRSIAKAELGKTIVDEQ
jgi:hypothetical protein